MKFLEWDFDKIILAHGDLIETNAKFPDQAVIWSGSAALLQLENQPGGRALVD